MQIGLITGSQDISYMLISGFFVFFMQAGFAMLCAGSVRSKNVMNILIKNVLDACIGCMAYFCFGYAISYGTKDSNSLSGEFAGEGFFFLAKGDHDEKRLTSCGRPTLFSRTALLDPDGHPVAPGEVGEICVSGPLLSGGYWNLPEETAKTFTGGWLRTGDMAREDDDGFWFIVDRVKDMIVTGGFNVFPREVEDVVAEHPAVAQVCVIGTPDEKWGEAVTAVVVLRPDQPSDPESVTVLTREIQEAVKERKGSVQSPKQVIVVDSVPVTALGKPDKKAVRARFWAEAGRAVG